MPVVILLSSRREGIRTSLLCACNIYSYLYVLYKNNIYCHITIIIVIIIIIIITETKEHLGFQCMVINCLLFTFSFHDTVTLTGFGERPQTPLEIEVVKYFMYQQMQMVMQTAPPPQKKNK